MLFSSFIFLYIFLPILIIVYFSVSQRYQNFILLIASLLFYAWGEPKYIVLLLCSIIINHLGALWVEKVKDTRGGKSALFLLVLINLGVLVYFKYLNFVFDCIGTVFYLNKFVSKEIIMPIGISFYTFQALSYVFDVYRGTVKAEKNIFKTALYISFFPQLIAGPIIKYHDISTQIDNREMKFENFILGLKRFIAGLSKKVIIANTIGVVVDKIFSLSPDNFSPVVAWLGALGYSLQLFFDFSGYADMAIGLGLVFGFKILENFNYPYISKSITEFWRRWHISLSNWFKDYVYIPLGGNKSGIYKTVRNLAIVFLLTGLWHGASSTFVVWGLYNGFFIITEKLLNIGKKDEFDMPKHWILYVIRHTYTLLVCLVGWVIFRSENLSYAVKYIKNMFGFLKIHDEVYPIMYYIERYELIILVVGIICSMPIFSKMLQSSEKNTVVKTAVNFWLIFLLVCSSMFLIASTYNPFIYFRF